MSKTTIFIEHHNFNIKENGKYLNIFSDSKKIAEKKMKILQEENPDYEYELVYIGNDVNDLAMRIVNYTEKFSGPKLALEIDGKREHKIYRNYASIERKIEELKGENDKVDTNIVVLENGSKYPDAVCLEQRDYDLLKKHGKINLEKNTTFGLEIEIKKRDLKGDKKNGKIYRRKASYGIC